MNGSLSQVTEIIKAIPLSKKISMAFILILLIAGFAFMFIWANKPEYRVLFNNLSPKDAGAIITKLKERNIQYKLEANGSVVMVPSENVYDLRLGLAGEGLPAGGNVGFEIFDQTDFGTTKFVQELNYRRALQGELARTISQFKEINSSRVFIVVPKESLFIEESEPATASIQLDLRSDLSPNKLESIVHLVSNAVEGLQAQRVSVVDTEGRIIFKGGGDNSTSSFLSDAQIDYKNLLENRIRKNVQSMLEAIVGTGKAIVRVNAEVDFSNVTLSEEEFDPYNQVVRSERDVVESVETSEGVEETTENIVNRRRGVVEPSTGSQRKQSKKDSTTNYEINRITRKTLKPAGSINRLSVAAVIDGKYKTEKLEDGTVSREYVPRSQEEMIKFEEIVKRAMGYNEDREDKMSVSSIPFSRAMTKAGLQEEKPGGFDFQEFLSRYKRAMINIILLGLVFFLVIRPLLKTLKKAGEESKAIYERRMLGAEREEYEQIPERKEKTPKEKAMELSKGSPETTEQVLKGWMREAK